MCVVYSAQVLSWQSISEAKISELVQYNLGTGKDSTIVKFEDNGGETLRCHVPYENTAMTSLVLTLFASQKASTIHCYDEQETIGGYSTSLLHRVAAKP